MTTLEAHQIICNRLIEGNPYMIRVPKSVKDKKSIPNADRFGLTLSRLECRGRDESARANTIFRMVRAFMEAPTHCAEDIEYYLYEIALTGLESRALEKPEFVLAQLTTLTDAKNHDYGDSYYETHKLLPDSIRIRLYDKASRLVTLDKCTTAKVQDEKWEDTMLDLINYCILELAALLRDKEPKDGR